MNEQLFDALENADTMIVFLIIQVEFMMNYYKWMSLQRIFA